MDQKHNMLYPPLEPGAGSMPHDQRVSASAAIGLPTEAPPSYDMAMAATAPSSPRSRVASVVFEQPTLSGVTILPYEPPMQQHDQLAFTPPSSTSANIGAAETTNLRLGPHPCTVTCPACGERNTTRVSHTSNTHTHLYSVLLCIVGWYCCACCVPYCLNSCRTGNHYCEKCNTYLGAYNPTLRK